MKNFLKKKISDIFEVGCGVTAPQDSKYYDKGSTPFVRANDLNFIDLDNNVIPQENSFVNEKCINECKLRLFRKGSIVFPKSGMSIRTNNIGILKDDSYIVNHLAALYNEEVSVITIKYVFYYLRYYGISNLAPNLSGYPSIRLKDIRNFEIVFPSYEIQKQIVEEITSVENKIKEVSSKLDRLNMEHNELIKSLFNRNKQNTRIKDVCIINPSKNEVDKINDEMEVSFIPMANVDEDGLIVKRDVRKLNEVRSGYTYFREGDILFAKITPSMENGKGAIALGLKNSIGFGSTEFHVIRPIDIHPMIIYSILQHKEFREEAKQNMTGVSGHRRVPKTYLELYEIPQIPKNEQEIMGEKIKKIINKKEIIKDEIKRLQNLRNVIIGKHVFNNIY